MLDDERGLAVDGEEGRVPWRLHHRPCADEPSAAHLLAVPCGGHGAGATRLCRERLPVGSRVQGGAEDEGRDGRRCRCDRDLRRHERLHERHPARRMVRRGRGGGLSQGQDAQAAAPSSRKRHEDVQGAHQHGDGLPEDELPRPADRHNDAAPSRTSETGRHEHPARGVVPECAWQLCRRVHRGAARSGGHLERAAHRPLSRERVVSHERRAGEVFPSRRAGERKEPRPRQPPPEHRRPSPPREDNRRAAHDVAVLVDQRRVAF